MKSNKQKCQCSEQRKVCVQGHARRQVAHAPKTPSYPPPPRTFKSQVMAVELGGVAGSIISLCTVLWGKGIWWCHREYLYQPQAPGGLGLSAHGHQWLNLPFGGGFFTSAKWLRKCASNTVILVLQRGAKTAEVGEILSPPDTLPAESPMGSFSFSKGRCVYGCISVVV